MNTEMPEGKNKKDKRRALDVVGVAEALDVSPMTVRELIRRGKLRCVRVGRLVRIPSEAVDDFLGAK